MGKNKNRNKNKRRNNKSTSTDNSHQSFPNQVASTRASSGVAINKATSPLNWSWGWPALLWKGSSTGTAPSSSTAPKSHLDTSESNEQTPFSSTTDKQTPHVQSLNGTTETLAEPIPVPKIEISPSSPPGKCDSVISSTWEDSKSKSDSKAESSFRRKSSIQPSRWWPCRTMRWIFDFFTALARMPWNNWRTLQDSLLTLGLLVICLWGAYIALELLLKAIPVAAAQELDGNCSVVYVTVPGPIITVSLIGASPTNPARGTYYFSVVNGSTQWLNSIAPPSRFSTLITRTPEITPIISSVSLTVPPSPGASTVPPIGITSTSVAPSLSPAPSVPELTFTTSLISDSTLITVITSAPDNTDADPSLTLPTIILPSTDPPSSMPSPLLPSTGLYSTVPLSSDEILSPYPSSVVSTISGGLLTTISTLITPGLTPSPVSSDATTNSLPEVPGLSSSPSGSDLVPPSTTADISLVVTSNNPSSPGPEIPSSVPTVSLSTTPGDSTTVLVPSISGEPSVGSSSPVSIVPTTSSSVITFSSTLPDGSTAILTSTSTTILTETSVELSSDVPTPISTVPGVPMPTASNSSSPALSSPATTGSLTTDPTSSALTSDDSTVSLEDPSAPISKPSPSLTSPALSSSVPTESLGTDVGASTTASDGVTLSLSDPSTGTSIPVASTVSTTPSDTLSTSTLGLTSPASVDPSTSIPTSDPSTSSTSPSITSQDPSISESSAPPGSSVLPSLSASLSISSPLDSTSPEPPSASSSDPLSTPAEASSSSPNTASLPSLSATSPSISLNLSTSISSLFDTETDSSVTSSTTFLPSFSSSITDLTSSLLSTTPPIESVSSAPGEPPAPTFPPTFNLTSSSTFSSSSTLSSIESSGLPSSDLAPSSLPRFSTLAPPANLSSSSSSSTISPSTLTSTLTLTTTAPPVTTTSNSLAVNATSLFSAQAMTKVIAYGSNEFSFVFPSPSITTTISYWTGMYPTVTGPLPSELQTIPLTTRTSRQTPVSALPSFELFSSKPRRFKTVVTTIYEDEEATAPIAKRQIVPTAIAPTQTQVLATGTVAIPDAPGPSSCGESGNFTLTFDDTVVGSNDNNFLLVAHGMNNPYHHLFYANGYTYVPDMWEPYPAISQPNVAMFLPLAGRLLPNSPFAGTMLPGELGAGPRASVNAYWFNAYSAYFGCALNGLERCTLRITGYRYDAVLGEEVVVAEQNVTLPACPLYINCRLTQVFFATEFRALSGIQFNAYTYLLGIPQVHMMDDLQMEWYNNSCSAGIMRIGHS